MTLTSRNCSATSCNPTVRVHVTSASRNGRQAPRLLASTPLRPWSPSSASDAGSGISKVEVSVNGGPWQQLGVKTTSFTQQYSVYQLQPEAIPAA